MSNIKCKMLTRSTTNTNKISKLAKKAPQKKLIINEKQSPNISNISIISMEDASINEANNLTHEDLILDLRDKVARYNGDILSLTEERDKLLKNIDNLKTTIEQKMSQVESLTKTLERLNIKKIYCSVETQTETIIKCDEIKTTDKKGPRNQKLIHKDHINKSKEKKAKNITINKPESCNTKILLLSDSHGRNLSLHMRQKLNKNVKLDSIFKPNANFQCVTENFNQLTKYYNTDDFVIITAGTNDQNIEDYKQSVTNIVKNCEHTNLIINMVPYRYDCVKMNTNIYEQNKYLFELSSKYKFKTVDLNVFLNRKDYTRHGLHLNMYGKEKISDIFLEVTKSVKKCDVNDYKENFREILQTTNRN